MAPPSPTCRHAQPLTQMHQEVAVIGLGAHGIVALKNLLEEGFEVTGFDRNAYVSGIWHASTDDKLSSLPTTVVNVSHERACFTDFPFPSLTSSYPTAAQIDKYLNDYCTAFSLWPKVRLNTSVEHVEYDDAARLWRLEVRSNGSRESLAFDKLVVATGPYHLPVQPELPGSEAFEGDILHSVRFKDPTKFEGKNVVVVGMGNTAVDTATGLVDHAKKVYLAHRNGCALLPRILNDGTSLDHGASYRTFAIRDILETLFPRLAISFVDNWVAAIQKKHFPKLNPQWRINSPTPSLAKQNPTVSDTLYPALLSNNIISTHAPKQISGQHAVKLEDGQVLGDIDAIIFCTGYRLDLSWLGKYDPTNLEPDSNSPRYDYTAPRLYQNILSHERPESLAFIGLALVFNPAFVMADMSSQALAQLWGHPERLPTQTEMLDHYAKHLAWRSGINALPNMAGKGPHPLQLETGQFMRWVQDTAGTRLDEHLSYTSLKAWKLWWQDRELSRLLYDGIYSPHSYRLFDSGGRRRKWDGARDAILQVNADVKKRTKDDMLLTKVEMLPRDVIVNA